MYIIIKHAKTNHGSICSFFSTKKNTVTKNYIKKPSQASYLVKL